MRIQREAVASVLLTTLLLPQPARHTSKDQAADEIVRRDMWQASLSAGPDAPMGESSAGSRGSYVHLSRLLRLVSVAHVAQSLSALQVAIKQMSSRLIQTSPDGFGVRYAPSWIQAVQASSSALPEDRMLFLEGIPLTHKSIARAYAWVQDLLPPDIVIEHIMPPHADCTPVPGTSDARGQPNTRPDVAPQRSKNQALLIPQGSAFVILAGNHENVKHLAYTWTQQIFPWIRSNGPDSDPSSSAKGKPAGLDGLELRTLTWRDWCALKEYYCAYRDALAHDAHFEQQQLRKTGKSHGEKGRNPNPNELAPAEVQLTPAPKPAIPTSISRSTTGTFTASKAPDTQSFTPPASHDSHTHTCHARDGKRPASSAALVNSEPKAKRARSAETDTPSLAPHPPIPMVSGESAPVQRGSSTYPRGTVVTCRLTSCRWKQDPSELPPNIRHTMGPKNLESVRTELRKELQRSLGDAVLYVDVKHDIKHENVNQDSGAEAVVYVRLSTPRSAEALTHLLFACLSPKSSDGPGPVRGQTDSHQTDPSTDLGTVQQPNQATGSHIDRGSERHSVCEGHHGPCDPSAALGQRGPRDRQGREITLGPTMRSLEAGSAAVLAGPEEAQYWSSVPLRVQRAASRRAAQGDPQAWVSEWA